MRRDNPRPRLGRGKNGNTQKGNGSKNFSEVFIGDKFGESLGGSEAPLSFWEVPGLPRKFPKLPRKFFGDFPASSLTVELNSNPEVPRKFPKLPRKIPKLPRKFPDFPGGQPLSLESLTASPDSQKLSLILAYHAVGNYYLKYSWEYLMQKNCITYSFILGNPNILGNFCCLMGRTNWERIT